MGKRDPRVDAYIATAADFAKPILTSIRDAVHAACPDVEEDMKWRSPAFMYKGILCGMTAFTFDKFPPSHKREYVEWITDAKREETRTRRLQTAVRQIAEGKPQHWKYMK